MARLLLIEDDRPLRDGLVAALSRAGHSVTAAPTAATARAALTDPAQDFDLALVDITLPDGDGRDLAHLWRDVTAAPLVFLTARDTAADVLAGFGLGADDYIAKPFALDILLARIAAVLRRSRTGEDTVTLGPLSVTPAARRVDVDGQAVTLPPQEYDLLDLLVSARGRVVTRRQVAEALWDDPDGVDDNSVNVAVARLRRHLGAAAPLVTTVFGIGYKLEVT
jgi:DNA-binding response OmpR family regulator